MLAKSGALSSSSPANKLPLEKIGAELGMFVQCTENKHHVEKRFSQLPPEEQERVAADLLTRVRARLDQIKLIEGEAEEAAEGNAV